jgi:hypothetical protein
VTSFMELNLALSSYVPEKQFILVSYVGEFYRFCTAFQEKSNVYRILLPCIRAACYCTFCVLFTEFHKPARDGI